MLGSLYAAEAYHSRGAIRYVVGAMQMEDEHIKSKLTLLDLWCTMLENWGDAMKKHKHANAEKKTAEEKLIKMSKYLWRTWKAMIEIFGKMKKDTKITVSIDYFEIFRTEIIALHKLFFVYNTKNKQTPKIFEDN